MANPKQRILGALPAWAYDALQSVRKRWRRRDWERRVRKEADLKITSGQLTDQLRALGLERGRDTIVHGSLSRLGFVEGGAEAVIGAIREVLGPAANLLMPVYPMKGSMLKTMEDPGSFRIAEDPSNMGKISEVFRRMPGVLRSGHPTHSVAAQGPEAESYVAEHHLSRSPCGPGSPFRLLSERQGLILCLGTGVGKVTSHHVVEDLVDAFPVSVYLPEPYRKTVIFPDGSEKEVEVLVHDPRLAPLRIDNHREKEREMLAEMKRRGVVREGPLGAATAHLIDAAGMDAMHRELIAKGVTIYALNSKAANGGAVRA